MNKVVLKGIDKRERLRSAFNVSYGYMCDSLSGKYRTPKAKKIRYTAIKEFGAVMELRKPLSSSEALEIIKGE